MYHTLLLGSYKYLLIEFVPQLTERMKDEVHARTRITIFCSICFMICPPLGIVIPTTLSSKL